MKRNKKDKVLNLYAGLGGNRKLWTGVNVTAVELDPDAARLYQKSFPNDIVIIGDAHQYLLDHFNEYDFIWASPPCPSHSPLMVNFANAKGNKKRPVKYIDLKLYQEIILLDHFFKGRYVVENVRLYYEPLIKSKKNIGHHLFWSNFKIGSFFDTLGNKKHNILRASIKQLSLSTTFDVSSYMGIQYKHTLLRNCVPPEIGLYIYNESKRQGMFKIKELL